MEIENVHRQMATGKPLKQAILDGAQEIALPAFVSTLCICIVFVPMFFLAGVARHLFVPLAEAVVFAMLASYILSRTLIPTLVLWFYRSVYHRFVKEHSHPADDSAEASGRMFRKREVPERCPLLLRPFGVMQQWFEHGFTRFREGYRYLLAAVLAQRWSFCLLFILFCAASWLLDRKVRMTGGETIAYEWIPAGRGHALLPVHRMFLVEKGVHIIEGMNLTPLSDAGVYEFVFVVAPVKVVGATGVPVRPFAIA